MAWVHIEGWEKSVSPAHVRDYLPAEFGECILCPSLHHWPKRVSYLLDTVSNVMILWPLGGVMAKDRDTFWFVIAHYTCRDGDLLEVWRFIRQDSANEFPVGYF